MAYIMQNSFDCGLALELDILNRLGIKVSYEELSKKWAFPKREFLANLRDSPGAHWRILRSYKVPWRLTNLGEILSGKYKPDYTVVLVHNLKSPLSTVLVQHWTSIHEVTETHVFLNWGVPNEETPDLPPKSKKFTHEDFGKMYYKGLPACAFIVGEGDMKWTWEMTWDFLLHYLLYIPGKI